VNHIEYKLSYPISSISSYFTTLRFKYSVECFVLNFIIWLCNVNQQKCAFCWLTLYNCITMHSTKNINFIIWDFFYTAKMFIFLILETRTLLIINNDECEITCNLFCFSVSDMTINYFMCSQYVWNRCIWEWKKFILPQVIL